MKAKKYIFFLIPKIKIWKENDGNKGFYIYWNDCTMRHLLKKWYTIHIEFKNVKICIYSEYINN